MKTKTLVWIAAILFMLLVLASAGVVMLVLMNVRCFCGGHNHPRAEVIAGFIEIRDDRLHITPVEVFMVYDENDGWWTQNFSSMVYSGIEMFELGETQRMAEYGLTLYDFPSSIHIRPNFHADLGWHYVEQANIEVLSFRLDDRTIYEFIDYSMFFVDDPYGNRRYTTNVLDEFLQYNYPTAVHFVEVREGVVLRVVRELIFAI